MEALETKYIEQPDEATLIILLPRGSHPDYLKTIILLKSTTEHLSRDLTPCIVHNVPSCLHVWEFSLFEEFISSISFY